MKNKIGRDFSVPGVTGMGQKADEKRVPSGKLCIVFWILLVGIGAVTGKKAWFGGTIWANEGEGTAENAVPEMKYTHDKLDNGLEIYVFEDHQVPLAEVTLWYRVGSLDEPEGLTGISHVLEHSMFLGTKTLKKEQVFDLVKQVGGSNNASTGYEATRYYEKVPVANLELALAIEADRMQNLAFDPDEFRRELQVVQQERRLRIESKPFDSAFETIRAAAYTKSALHHSVIGWMQDLGNLTPEKVRQYYQKYYMPNNAILTVCGDVAPQRVFDLAKTYFGDIPSQPINWSMNVEPEQKQERRLTVTKVTNIPCIALLYKLPAGDHPDMAAIRFLLRILVDQRVKSALQNKQELLVDVKYSLVELPVSSFAQIMLFPADPEKITASETGFDAELSKLIASGIKDSEFEGLKKKYLKDLTLSRRNVGKMAEKVIGGIVKYEDPGYYQRAIKASLAVTKAELIRAAQKYFVKEKRTVGYVVPEAIAAKAKLEANQTAEGEANDETM